MDKSEPHIYYFANNASYRITKNINDKPVYLNGDLQWDAYEDVSNRMAHIDQAIDRWRALCGSVTNRTIYIQYDWHVANSGTNRWLVMNDTYANTHYLRIDGSVKTTCGYEGFYETAQEAVKTLQHYIKKQNKKQKGIDSPPQPQPTMNIKTVYITTPTLFKGEDISVMSPDRIMDNIRQLNIDKKNLVSLDVESKAVQEGIANINKAIAVLIMQLDT